MTYERTCKYGCNTQLGEFDTKENKFLETDGKTLHTRERCESLKQKQPKQEGNGNNNDVSLELVLKKLASIGITIDLEKLKNA
jgi:hypothetical protein